MILIAESNGTLVADTDPRLGQRQTSLAPGCSWNRKLPDMDGGYDVDNPAYSDDDEDDDFYPDDWDDEDEDEDADEEE
jgi:hypothetical protein